MPAIHEMPRSCLSVSDVLDKAEFKFAAAGAFLDSGIFMVSSCLFSNGLDEECDNVEVLFAEPNLPGVGGDADIAMGDLLESPKLMPPIVDPFPVVS